MPVLLSALLVAGGCSPGTTFDKPDFEDARVPMARAADPDADFTAISRLLERRARAVVRGDRARFLATVSRADPRLRRQQAALFDNLQELPVDKMYYGVETMGLRADKVRGGGRTLRPPVVEHVRLRGITRRPISNQLTMTFVERNGRWVVGAEREDPAFEAQLRPWFGTRIEASAEQDLLVLTDLDADDDSEELIDSTRDALASVTDVLDEEVDEPLLLDATTNGVAVELSNSSGEDAAAVSFSAYATDRLGGDFTGVAVAVVKANPDYVDQLVDNDETLRHELTHYVLNGYGTSNPQWVTEGLAEWVGYQPGLLADSFIEDEELERLIDRREVELTPAGRWGDDPTLDYLSAEAFAEFLISRSGLDAYREMMDLFERLGRSRSVTYGEGIVDTVLRRVYGLTPDEVARGGFDLLQGL